MENKKRDFRKEVFEILEVSEGNIPSRIFDIFIVSVIVIDIVAMIMETFAEFEAYMPLFHFIEEFSILVFSIEFILRLWTADLLYPESSPLHARIRFIFSVEGIIDLLTILPFVFFGGFVVFRLLRVIRILHLFKINEKFDSFHVIKSVLIEKKNQIASTIMIIMILMLGSSLFLYAAEHEAQPDVFQNAFSGIWFSVSTLFTIGYGDIYPITVAGKFMTGVISFLGVGLVAIPTGIISAGFVENYTELANSEGLFELHNVVVDIDSRWIGLSAEEVRKEYHVVIAVVKREEAIFQPNENYRVMLNDRIAAFPEHL